MSRGEDLCDLFHLEQYLPGTQTDAVFQFYRRSIESDPLDLSDGQHIVFKPGEIRLQMGR